jgi:hypothetical protein
MSNKNWIPKQRDRVEHEKHGIGTVSTAYRDVRGNARVCVRFDKFRETGGLSLGTGTWVAAGTLKPAPTCCEFHNDNCRDIEEVCCAACPGRPPR